jgi:hypothetical protein
MFDVVQQADEEKRMKCRSAWGFESIYIHTQLFVFPFKSTDFHKSYSLVLKFSYV